MKWTTYEPDVWATLPGFSILGNWNKWEWWLSAGRNNLVIWGMWTAQDGWENVMWRLKICLSTDYSQDFKVAMKQACLRLLSGTGLMNCWLSCSSWSTGRSEVPTRNRWLCSYNQSALHQYPGMRDHWEGIQHTICPRRLCSFYSSLIWGSSSLHGEMYALMYCICAAGEKINECQGS